MGGLRSANARLREVVAGKDELVAGKDHLLAGKDELLASQDALIEAQREQLGNYADTCGCTPTGRRSKTSWSTRRRS